MFVHMDVHMDVFNYFHFISKIETKKWAMCPKASKIEILETKTFLVVCILTVPGIKAGI